MSEESTGKEDELKVLLPDFLEPGHNFYDQRPFSTVLTALEEKYGIPNTVGRRAITVIARSMGKIPEGEAREKDEERLNIFKKVRDDLWHYHPYPNIPTKILRGYVSAVSTRLDRYSEWDEYVRVEGITYKNDGNPTSADSLTQKQATYVKWLGDRLRRRRSIIRGEIEKTIADTPSNRALKKENRMSGHDRHF
jgi:hypothetical protein